MHRSHPWIGVSLALASIVLLAVAPRVADARGIHTSVLRKTPYYTGKVPAGGATLAHLPLRVGQGFAEPGMNAEMRAAVEGRLAECGEFLATLGTRPLGAVDLPGTEGPVAYVGAPDGFHAPIELLDEEERGRHGREAVVVQVTDPSAKWHRPLGARAVELGADHLLLVTVDLSDYPIAQKNWKGSKAVELGTGHRMAVPWLTSLDQPAEVLQFRGVLYRADGRFVRAGAEAFHALRTPFRQSVLHLQRPMVPPDLEQAFAAVREDLPGEQLAWQVALRNLVAQLTGRKEAIVAAGTN